MLTFNQLLRVGHLEPETVRLLRHRDSTPRIHRALYDAAMTLDPKFAQYQERQGTQQVIEQFRSARYLAGFIVEPWTQQTVFAGLWERLDERSDRKDNPFQADPPGSPAIEFNTRRLESFDEYCGRLVIDWGDGTRAWVQRADKQDKRIVELRKTKKEPDFPGFLAFQMSLDQVDGLYVGWTQILRHARGIYLLVKRKTGEQYIGSASGSHGFVGRWLGYQDGHGGNVGMRELGAAVSDYDVNILEVVASNATTEDIYARENLWKAKLGTRVVGLNRN
jgi:hypothetical protein